MSARASGADAGDSNGSARSRGHHDGSSGRSYTVEQKATVIRVRKCGQTAYYDILGLESVKTSCSEADIKKAYRKLSLLTHPDKNGYDGADEAFKMVSKAFQVLSDPDKKTRFDKFGGDPESRHQQASTSPFGGGFASSAAGRGPMFEEEISPEEMFRQFFGGGMGGGFPGFAFDTGPQFVFNMGGPGIRVTQFGGGMPRRRPRAGEAQQQQSASNILTSLLPLLLLFILPLLSQLFSGSGSPGPNFTLDKSEPPYTKALKTRALKVPYWVDPSEYRDLSRSQREKLDHRVEVRLVSDLNARCEKEQQDREHLYYAAQGWFTVDKDKEAKARNFKMPSCERLQKLKNAA